MTLSEFLQSGVRFTRAPDCSLRVTGPNDPALMLALKEAVAQRVTLLRDGLPAARARVWKDWLAAGKPVAVRSGIDKTTKVEWTARLLPDGVCETCGQEYAVVRDGMVVVTGSGMCALCECGWAMVRAGRASVEREAA